MHGWATCCRRKAHQEIKKPTQFWAARPDSFHSARLYFAMGGVSMPAPKEQTPSVFSSTRGR
eukprot:6876311-Lingulodinium_polyedra.AAC.1